MNKWWMSKIDIFYFSPHHCATRCEKCGVLIEYCYHIPYEKCLVCYNCLRKIFLPENIFENNGYSLPTFGFEKWILNVERFIQEKKND